MSFRSKVLPVFGLAAALGVAGCSMVSSYNTSLLTDGGSPRQGAGAYHLPKHILIATVTQVAPVNGKVQPYDINLVRSAIADPNFPMNVGFDLAPTSDDTIEIKYANGLLQVIDATAHDKSKDVIVNFTKSLTSILNRVGTATADQSFTNITKLLQVSFDPFDPYDHHRANSELVRFGFCIAFARDARSPATMGCESGHQHHNVANSTAKQIKAARAATENTSGLFFRQPMEHKIQIYYRHAARCPGSWCMRWEGYSAFANSGPLLRVNVERTLFVKRETKITFGADGVPTEAKVTKPAEAVALAHLPLDVLGAIVKAPVAAVVAPTSVPEQKVVAAAQARQIEAQTDYIRSLNDSLKSGQPVPEGHGLVGAGGVAVGRSASERSLDGYRSLEEGGRARREFFKNCEDIGLDTGGCQTEWRKYQ